jgi:hypothetical protein
MHKRLLLIKGLKYTLTGITLLGIALETVHRIEEAQRLVKARRKRRPGFSFGLDFED